MSHVVRRSRLLFIRSGERKQLADKEQAKLDAAGEIGASHPLISPSIRFLLKNFRFIADGAMYKNRPPIDFLQDDEKEHMALAKLHGGKPMSVVL